jgi:hypothetical protein
LHGLPAAHGLQISNALCRACKAGAFSYTCDAEYSLRRAWEGPQPRKPSRNKKYAVRSRGRLPATKNMQSAAAETFPQLKNMQSAAAETFPN